MKEKQKIENYTEYFLNSINTKNIITLIGVHIIVTDDSIDDKELQVIFNYNKDLDEIENEINDIYTDSPNKIPLKLLLNELKSNSKEVIHEAYKLFIEIIYSDGYYDKKEKEKVEEIRKIIQIDEIEFSQIENIVLNNLKLYTEKESDWTEGIRLKFYGFMENLSSNDNNRFSKKKREILLNGRKFAEKIKEISEYARADLDFSGNILSQSSERISELLDELTHHIQKVKKSKRKDSELNDFVKVLQKVVRDNALNQLKENIEVLNKKRRSVDYFTISFLGRTKAGKSTLHSIITKDGDDAIGEGKVRTTRYNRVYNWENLRIIDTPGIGAPNGESDVDIAKSIVDESDLICYLVTNDAIQETEFKFLSKIKKKNKPVIILLNIKENIYNERRRKIFLKNPLKWKERTDNKSIKGHVDRINEYMNKYYHNNFYRVVPVMLLAAKLSEKEQRKDTKALLYKASNVDELLLILKDSVFKNGHLRKSQNIIDGANVRLNNIYDEFSIQFNEIKTIIGKLKKEKTSFTSYVENIKPEREKNIIRIIDSYMCKLKKSAKDFALNNYNLNKKELQKRWEVEYQNRGFIKQLDEEIKLEFAETDTLIKNRLEESIENFQIYFNNISFVLRTSSTTNTRRYTEVGGGLIGLAGTIALSFGLFSNPIGWGVLISGFVISISSNLFKSKDLKIKLAQEKIEKSLIEQINKLEKQYKNQAIKDLDKMLSGYLEVLRSNMDELIKNSNSIKRLLEKELKSSKYQIRLLNKAFIIRLLQHSKFIKFSTDLKYITENDKSIYSIDRCFETNKIQLSTQHKIDSKTEKNISQLIQSDFKIIKEKEK